jgi:predicted RNase H-like HicB family nuclease
MAYVVVYEQTDTGFSAYVPDLPGCVAAGETREETECLIRAAIAFHLEGLRESEEAIPKPGTWTEIGDVSA